MANSLYTNPIRFDTTTGATWNKTKYVRLIQWVDLNEDVADGDMLLMQINGCPVEAEIQIDATLSSLTGAVVWNMGPFNPGIPVQDFTLTTLDGGAVYIWVD